MMTQQYNSYNATYNSGTKSSSKSSNIKAGDVEDDLYEGFNYSIDLAPPQTSQTKGIPLASSYRAPPSQMGRGGIPQSRMGTAGGNSEARPMTSVSGAGFSSNPRTAAGQRMFDPLGQANRGPAPPLAQKRDNSPEELIKEMERQVNTLIEESAEAATKSDYVLALEKAKEAGKKERQLCKHRESNGLADQINFDLTYSVCFNLANVYALNEMYNEALHTYGLIVKNKQYPQSGRLRVNMGNIYYQQQKYTTAIKMYRMALDQIPNTGKEIRFKIMRNIGSSFVRLGQFQDAIQSFETIMEGNADFQSGFNLIICYYALGDADKMRKGFTKLLSIPIPGVAEDEEDEEEDHKTAEAEAHADILPDGLRAEIKQRQKQAQHYILQAAKMCAPVLDRRDWVAGYDWIIDELKADHGHAASEMEICKALHFLKEKQFDKAIEVLKSFEKKDHALKAMAATNLSFLYFLEGDIAQADKYANMAVRHKRYNAKALVNKGNCLFVKNELERAKELYLEAIGVEADCVEAIYNLGLVNKQMGILNEAEQAFEKLHSIVPNRTEVIYQIANLHDLMGNYRQAVKWFNILTSCFGTSKNIADPGVLSRLGQIFNKDEDETQAFHYHLESYRFFPVNLDVISWLGVWYVKSELYEKAIQFFERASQIQPTEVKWRLMVTSCYRRMGSYQKALQFYEAIHAEYPENLECLRYLVAICKDLGQRYDHHQQKLAKLEKIQAAKTQQTSGAGALTRIGGGAPQQQQQQPQQNESMNNQDQKQAMLDRKDKKMVSEETEKPAASRPLPQPVPKPMASRELNQGMNKDVGMQNKGNSKDMADEDEFGDTDVGDLLAD